ncbi:hypothetical protein [Psychrobacter sp. I-STPA6b]|uniref:hypothetical protein n=1 Tax=Psychrobacter sp. I-STPA6b TaxID=2585718 RepID=UPI001D0BFE44|nr:hypothetical protein [Psychrobacter sp. I-STPA6b]
MDTPIADNELVFEEAEQYHRIDTQIASFSSWKWGFIALYLATLIMIAVLTDVTLWVMLVIIAMSVIALLGMFLRQPRLVHLTSPVLYHRQGYQGEHWQLVYDKAEHHELWEAKLLQCRDFGKCLIVEFAVSHQHDAPVSISLWQDQITPISWRRLKALARW